MLSIPSIRDITLKNASPPPAVAGHGVKCSQVAESFKGRVSGTTDTTCALSGHAMFQTKIKPFWGKHTKNSEFLASAKMEVLTWKAGSCNAVFLVDMLYHQSVEDVNNVAVFSVRKKKLQTQSWCHSVVNVCLPVHGMYNGRPKNNNTNVTSHNNLHLYISMS